MRRLGISRSVRGTVVAAPVIVLVIVAVVVALVMARIERHQTQLFEEQRRLIALQRQAARLPLLLGGIQSALIEHAMLAGSGPMASDGAATARARLEALLAEFSALRRAGAPAVPQDLGAALDTYGTAVAEAIAPDVAPPDRAAASRRVAGLYAALVPLAERHVAEATARVHRDLDRGEAGTRDLNRRLSLVLAALVATLTAAAFLMAQLITGPVRRLAATVEALQRGDLDVEVPAADRGDELGHVARSVERFRDSLRDNRRLERERDELNCTLEARVAARTREVQRQKRQLTQAQIAREADRLQMAQQLRTEFGAVIHAAGQGDFTRRVATDLGDGDLARLAADVNALIETMDASIRAATEAVEALALGHERPPRNQVFAGTFGEMMDHIDETADKILRQSDRLKHTALHDALTGLPNRRYLEERLAAEAPAVAEGRHGLALMHVDIDRFKQINDTLGHVAGDRVLKGTAALLQEAARAGDFVARIGGDEFVLLCRYSTGADGIAPAPAARDRIEALARAILARFTEPQVIEGGQVRVTVSVGLAFSGEGRVNPSKLMIDADLALYEAKDRGRNQAQVFSPHLQTGVLERKRLADDLHRAVEHEQFVPYFQPQVDTATGAVVGVEALVRWMHPERGMIPPGDFIGTAAEVGLLPALDRLMLQRALEAVHRLNTAAETQVPRLSVNVGLDELTDPAYLAIADTAAGRGIGLCFELLETILFDEQGDEFAFTIDGLQERGILIEVDDFGSGRASISSLVRCRPDGIKIDRALVQSVIHDVRQKRLVGSIVEMAQGLDIGVVGEGVETPDHARVLQGLGCTVQQGYHFLRPVPEAGLRDWLRRTARTEVA